MESLCCMVGRRHRTHSNPLEGRVNLRLEGRTDYSDAPALEPLEVPQSAPQGDSAASGSGGRAPASASSSGARSNLLEVPRPSADCSASAASEDEAVGRVVGSTQGYTNGSQRSVEAANEQEAAGHASSSGSEGEGPDDHQVMLAAKARASTKLEAPPIKVQVPPVPLDRGKVAHQVPDKPTIREPPGAVEKAKRDAISREVEELAKKLRKRMWKYPSSGRTFFAQAKERYFAIVMSYSGEGKRGSVSHIHKNLTRSTALCYWEDEEACRSEEPLGAIPIATITRVEYRADVEKGLQVSVQTNTKDKKDGNIVLVLKLATAKEAKAWSSGLQTLVEAYRRWSAIAPDEPGEAPQMAGSMMVPRGSKSSEASSSPRPTGARRLLSPRGGKH